MTGSERLKHGMAAILGELENLYAQDLIGAVQINIALRDGNVRTLKAYDDGFRILLIAAAAIGQREAFDSAEVTRDPDSWHMPGECRNTPRLTTISLAAAPDRSNAGGSPSKGYAQSKSMLNSGPAAVVVCPSRKAKGRRGRLCAPFEPPGYLASLQKDHRAMCDIIDFPGGRVVAQPDTCVAAVASCDGDPKALFALAFTSMIIVRSGTVSEPGAVDFLTTAHLALSALLDNGEARP